MRLFIVLLTIVLSGCTILIDTHLIPPIRLTLQKVEPIYTGYKPVCSKFILPSMKPLPQAPTISTTIANDRKQTEKVLLEYIKSLKALIREEQFDIQEAYQEYLTNCK